ncbi:UNVERIFIED_CONTAM: hypothetical protein NY603_25515, partial [Bacteroidetes bacterium 56_B9]
WLESVERDANWCRDAQCVVAVGDEVSSMVNVPADSTPLSPSLHHTCNGKCAPLDSLLHFSHKTISLLLTAVTFILVYVD